MKRKYLQPKDGLAIEQGYIGSIRLTTDDWDLARITAQGRMIASKRRGRKAARDEKQFWLDMKGAIAEVAVTGFLWDAVAAKTYTSDEVLFSDLVAIAPDRKADLRIHGQRYDLKGSSAMIEGLSVRNDEFIAISKAKIGQYEREGYAGVLLAKSWGQVIDIYYLPVAEVKNLELKEPSRKEYSAWYAFTPQVLTDDEAFDVEEEFEAMLDD